MASLAWGSQGSGAYPGVDLWRNITLQEGTYIAQGTPGNSNFYTTLGGVMRSEGSTIKLWEGLQVQRNIKFGYRTKLNIYRVKSNMPAAMGSTSANPSHGPGGLPQLFLKNQENLELITTIPLK